MQPISLITIYHTGAYSAVRGFRDQGLTVAPDGGVGIESKIASIDAGRDADVIWAHWNWAHRLPDWVFDRHVVVILRDPVECAISALLRGHARKAPQQGRQWAQLYRHRLAVNDWIDYKALDFSRYGIEKMPRENTTASAPLKEAYKLGNHKHVEQALGWQYKALLIVWHEIRGVFEEAGMMDRFGESMLSDAVV